jgi:AraC-like DNA-binding protein
VNAYTSAVEANYASGKGIADYASDLGHTPADLTRYCKELCDLSASDILNQRIHYAAQEALSDAKVSFQQVAEDLGFSSPAYFTRSFENVTGESPERFRARTSAA